MAPRHELGADDCSDWVHDRYDEERDDRVSGRRPGYDDLDRSARPARLEEYVGL